MDKSYLRKRAEGWVSSFLFHQSDINSEQNSRFWIDVEKREGRKELVYGGLKGVKRR